MPLANAPALHALLLDYSVYTRRNISILLHCSAPSCTQHLLLCGYSTGPAQLCLQDCSHKTATIMSDRETRMMARMRREDEARRARRDQITTYGLVAVVVTFGGARYAGHRSLERACLALLAAFGLYAVGVALAAMNAYSESIMQLPEPDSDDEDHDHSHFHAGSISSSDSEDDKNK